MKIITSMAIFIALSLVFPTLIGEKNSELSKGDERQKKIFKEAAVGSWYSIVLYVILHFVSKWISNDSNVTTGSYIDILIVAIIGYIAFYFISLKKVI